MILFSYTTDTNLVPVCTHAIESTPHNSLATPDSTTSLEFEVFIAKESQHSLWRAFNPKMGSIVESPHTDSRTVKY